MTIELGCNYSQPLRALLAQGAVDVQWIKVSRPDMVEEDLAQARPLRPVLLHVVPGTGRRPETREGYPWGSLRRWLDQAGSPHIAVHLDGYAVDWDMSLEVDRQSREQVQAILERSIRAVRLVQGQLPIPVLVENTTYHGQHGRDPGFRQPLRVVTQPEAIWQVVEATGAGLLLDTSHLRCAAHNTGIDVRAYARALPLERVVEIHASGPRLAGDCLVDRHHPLGDEDYRLLEWLLGHTRPRVVTLEYGGLGGWYESLERNDPRALAAQLEALCELVAGG